MTSGSIHILGQNRLYEQTNLLQRARPENKNKESFWVSYELSFFYSPAVSNCSVDDGEESQVGILQYSHLTELLVV